MSRGSEKRSRTVLNERFPQQHNLKSTLCHLMLNNTCLCWNIFFSNHSPPNMSLVELNWIELIISCPQLLLVIQKRSGDQNIKMRNVWVWRRMQGKGDSSLSRIQPKAPQPNSDDCNPLQHVAFQMGIKGGICSPRMETYTTERRLCNWAASSPQKVN